MLPVAPHGSGDDILQSLNRSVPVLVHWDKDSNPTAHVLNESVGIKYKLSNLIYMKKFTRKALWGNIFWSLYLVTHSWTALCCQVPMMRSALMKIRSSSGLNLKSFERTAWK